MPRTLLLLSRSRTISMALFSYFAIHRILERHGIFPALSRKGVSRFIAFWKFVRLEASELSFVKASNAKKK